MNRILFAWELGSTYGHLARQVPIAEALRARGHEVSFAVRDTRVAAEVLGRRGFRFFQAPLCQPQCPPTRSPASYAELLAAIGYTDRHVLWGAVQSWLSLFALARPEVVEIDHAPTALVACRIARIPAVLVGNGFELPPRQTPLPSMRPWESIPAQRLQQSDDTVVEALNTVAKSLGGPALDCLADLFAGAPTLLASFPELDHYGVRAGEAYAGPIYFDPGGIEVDWPTSTSPRLFAYLRPSVPGFEALIKALKDLDANVICAVPGIAQSQARALSAPGLRVLTEPVALSGVLAETDLALSLGGIGTLTPFLLAGVPLALVPAVVEQYLICRRVEALGAGTIARDHSVVGFTALLRALLEQPCYRNAAQVFARRYAGFTPRRPTAQALALIEAALGHRRDKPQPTRHYAPPPHGVRVAQELVLR